MLTKINHIGIAVKSLDDALPFYRDNLGMAFLGLEEVAEQKVKVAMLQVGESKIELLEPTSEESPVAKFIEKTVPAFITWHTRWKTSRRRLQNYWLTAPG